MSTPVDIILAELVHARNMYPTFAASPEDTVATFVRELGEYATALQRKDIHGPHGAIREAAQLGAVAIRAIEYWSGHPQPPVLSAPHPDGRCGTCAWWKGGESGFHIDEVRKCVVPVPASIDCWGDSYVGIAMDKSDGKDCPCYRPEASA